jgi:tartrate-resistant acid phosphatase type 5
MLLFFLISCQSESTGKPLPGDVSEPTAEPAGEPTAEPAGEPAAEPAGEPAAEPSQEEEDGDGGAEEDTGEEPVEEPPKIVRFIAMGDGGEGNEDQYLVSQALEQVCSAKEDARPGCDFALYLGDNFYDSGVDGIDDPQFQTKFEEPYANLSFPFYVALGNHDYGGDCLFTDCGGLGNEFEKSEAQIEYTAYSDKWTLPDEYYTFLSEHVRFFGLDTNAIMWDPWLGTGEGQDDWLQGELAASTATWHIAYGHHPFISNGKHGNAGEYEGLDWLGIAEEVVVGDGVLEFMEENICGQIDMYLCGHDHNRQWMGEACGTEFIVSGAAAKTTDLEGRGNSTLFEDDTMEGFVWIEIQDNCLSGEFYDKLGGLDFSHQYCK